jgi:hypothetical protein
VSSIDRQDALHGIIELTTRASLKSWGEQVAISVAEVGPECEVVIVSRPWLPITMVDGGVNAKNVARLQAALCALERGEACDLSEARSPVSDAARVRAAHADLA